MKEIWVVIIKGIIAAVVPFLVIISYLFPRESKQQSKSYYAIILTTIVSVCLQFLGYIWGFLGDSIPIICVGGLIFTIAFMSVIILQPKFASEEIKNSRLPKSFLLTILLSNLLVPIMLASWVVKECDDKHRQLATSLINAMAEFKADTGLYPNNLEMLIPDYVTEIPAPTCFSVYRPFASKITNPNLLRTIEYPLMIKMIRIEKTDYYLVDCSIEEDGTLEEEYYLVVLTFDFKNKQRYSFSQGFWQTIPLLYGCGSYSSNQRYELALTPSFPSHISSLP